MELKKLSPEEIQNLRFAAETERATHDKVMKNLRAVIMSPELQMSILMSSYNRHRQDEIIALLDVHASSGREYELSVQVKIFIYKHGDELSDAKLFMLRNNHLGYELEKLIFDDKLPPFLADENDTMMYPKFCDDAEVYVVKETLKAYLKADKLGNELHFLQEYTKHHSLNEKGEVALMDFLFANTGRDSVLDTLEAFVLGYLVLYTNISAAAWLRIIQSGKHSVIMYLLNHSETLIKDEKIVAALHERAIFEELTAYYNRWARGD